MTHFVLCKNGRTTKHSSQLCRTADQTLCVWVSEEAAQEYADKHSYDKWRVRAACSEDYALFGRLKTNLINQTRPCYHLMDCKPTMAKKTTSSGSLVELYENYESRKFAVSSKADNEKEFLVEIADVMATTPSSDWNTRLKELLPLIVEMCCKYRGYKTDVVVERRELVAGDLDMPTKTF